MAPDALWTAIDNLNLACIDATALLQRDNPPATPAQIATAMTSLASATTAVNAAVVPLDAAIAQKAAMAAAGLALFQAIKAAKDLAASAAAKRQAAQG